MHIASIRIKFNFSILFLVGFIVWQLGLVAGLIVSSILYALITMHELAHAKTGEWYGVRTKDITLYALGGVVQMEDIDGLTPKQEMIVAAMGPISNFLAAIVIAFVAPIAGVDLLNLESMVTLFVPLVLFYTFWANIMIGVFNLIPAYPMDGGRILRSALSILLKSKNKATIYSIYVSKFFAVLFVLYGVVNGMIFLPIIGILLWLAGTGQLMKMKGKL